MSDLLKYDPEDGSGPIIPRFAPGGGRSFSGNRRVVALGWQPDAPDWRDQFFANEDVAKEFKKSNEIEIPGSDDLPVAKDNRGYCSPVENQGTLGSCTAHAVNGMAEYMMRRISGTHVDGSRLFLYKVTRNVMGLTGDTGAHIRTTMKAMAAFGVCPEEYYPYIVDEFETEPSAFHYQFGSNYRAMKYARLDPLGQTGEDTLILLKRVLAAEYAVAFGFSVFSSISRKADIPFPSKNDRHSGGHAVMAVGYDDEHAVFEGSKGSIIIRNSWGEGWGEKGYGYLPYEYITRGLARDFWVLTNQDWLEKKEIKVD